MDFQGAKPDTEQTLMKMCKDQFKETFSAYFIGLPDAVPQAALPCLIVQKLKSHIAVGPTMADDVTEDIMITVLVDSKEGFGTTDDDDTVMRKLKLLVEAIDPATDTFYATSLMGIIRQNITLKEHLLDHSEEINYDVSPRPNQPSIAEATIIMSTKERVYLPNRT